MNKISFLSANELVFTEQMCQFRVTELYKVTFQEKKSTFFTCLVLEKLIVLNSSHHLIKLNHKEDFNSMGELPNIYSCNNFILT